MPGKEEPMLDRSLSDLNVRDSDDQIIIGIDFGTTFSGVAYAFNPSSKPELVSILDWPGLESKKQPKVPTIISYKSQQFRSFDWGAQPHEGRRIEAIKLLLDPDQGKPIYVPAENTKLLLKELGKPAVEVAADYIRALHDHALERIATKVPGSYLQNLQRKYVMSVPAVWSDKAKATTLQAAKLAGVFPVTLVKEPEAAAMYTLHDLQDRGLEVGDAVVICDAGGGTVDLISYEILQRKPTLKLKELVPSKGGMAGSIQLNKRFEEQVKMLVGEDQYYHLRKTSAYDQALRFFDETVKIAFRGKKNESWYVNFPMAHLEDDESQGLKRSTWEMKSEVVESIFKPVIDDIGRMVDDQVNLVQNKRLAEGHRRGSKIKAIILVGGFGSSEFLKQSIERRHPDIQIIQPHDAWSAIVKGAVLSQLPQEAMITSTVAERHYGVFVEPIYDKDEDVGQPTRFDESRGELTVTKIWWFIEKGEDLQRDQRIAFPFVRRLKEDFKESELVFGNELITDESPRASRYPTAGVTKINCKFTSDLRAMDRGLLEKIVGVDRKNYVDVKCNLVITLASAIMKFSLEVNGKEMGSVTAKYE